MFILREETEVLINGPSGQLEARVAGFKDSSEPTRVGIMCHPHPLHQGSMDNKVVTTVIRAWLNLGLATVRFNYRGVGKSAGSYGEGKGEIEDLKAIKKWVQEKAPAAELWLGGFSFGTYIATHVAAEQAVAEQAAAEKTKEKIVQGIVQDNVQGNMQGNRIKALLTIAPPVQHFAFDTLLQEFPLPSCPWLIIQGDQDEVVPVEKVSEFFEKYHEKKADLKLIIMPGASHFFHGRLVELQKDIETEMGKYL